MSRAEGAATLLRLLSRSASRHTPKPSIPGCIAPAAGHARDLCTARASPAPAAEAAPSRGPGNRERSPPSDHPSAASQAWQSGRGQSRGILTAALSAHQVQRARNHCRPAAAWQLPAQHAAQRGSSGRAFASGGGGEAQDRRQGGGGDGGGQRRGGWATEEHRPSDYDEEMDDMAAAAQAEFAREWPCAAQLVNLYCLISDLKL